MSSPIKTSTTNSPLTNGSQASPQEEEKPSSAGIDSLKRLDAMREESARIAKEEQEKQNALQKVHHCGCSHAKQGECSS